MDIPTLALAKAYTDSKSLASSSWIYNQVNFLGDVAEKETISGEVLGVSGTFVFASNIVIAGGSLSDVSVMVTNDENYYQHRYTVHNPLIQMTDDGIALVTGYTNSPEINVGLYAISFGLDIANLLGVSPGTYVWTVTKDDGFHFYCDKVGGYFIEVIHPIDPKYIPALDSVTLNSPNGTQFKITVDDTGALTATEVTP